MKSFIVAVVALCSTVSAWPLMPWVQVAPPAAGTALYQLQAKSSATTVNNQWVTLASGATSYSLGSAQASAAKFFVQRYNATQTYAFHNTDDTRQLALRGQNGTLLYLVDVTSPTAETIPSGQMMEWATFTMDNNNLGVNDGSQLRSRTFAAVGTQLALYDGVTNTTGAVTPLTLSIVRAGSAEAEA